MIEPILPSEQLLISEFYPCGLCNDEYFVIFNPSQESLNMKGWNVTDGEGTLQFASDTWIAPGSRLAVSWNASSYAAAYSKMPDIAVLPGAQSRQVNLSGSFRLSDLGDSVTLLSVSGQVVDCVVYGREDASIVGWLGPSIPKLRMGEVGRRIELGLSYRDTNTASDWCAFREHRYGYTEIEDFRASLGPSELLAFTSPDCSLEVVLEAIGTAHSIIRLCTYELSSLPVCIALLERLEAGVDVNIMVDGAPSGGIDPKAAACFSVLARSGASVRLVNGNVTADSVQHVGAMHAKYLIIDSASALVISENFVESGLSVDKMFGNRGWGVWMRSTAVAQHLAELFDSDSRATRPDVLLWDEDSRYDQFASLDRPAFVEHKVGMIEPLRTNSASSVTIYISPDASRERPFLAPILGSASSLEIEQFQADLYWTPRWTNQTLLNPLISSMLDARSNGALSRLLLDSSWFSLERNTAVVEHLSSACSDYPDQLGAKLLDDRSPITILHNKGVVVDRHWTLVSSNNWVYASFARNREVAVLVESDQVAEYFACAFEYDWSADDEAPVAVATGRTSVVLGKSVCLYANMSSDDRAISDLLWDIDCDGTIDFRGMVLEFHPTRPGKTEVLLVAVDAWGNRDSVRVTVYVTSEFGATNGEALPSRLPLLLGVISALSGLFLGFRLARRRNRTVRKVNHPR